MSGSRRKYSVKQTGIVLAAGEGTRMNSKKPKILHEAGGAPLAAWVLRAMQGAGIDDIVVVVGHGADEIEKRLGPGVKYAVQSERLGSGHAALCALSELSSRPGYTFIAAGDMPLITSETIKSMFRQCSEHFFDCLLLSAVVKEPAGYGRVVRQENGEVVSIVEHKDASEEERTIREINASCYCVRTELLHEILPTLDRSNAQGEYYLTDIVTKIRERGGIVSAYTVDEEECLGVNDRVQLYEASKRLYRRTAEKHMRAGVTIIDADTAYIDPDTRIGADTVIYPGVFFENGCTVGEGATFYPGSRISASRIGAGTTVQNSVLTQAVVGENTIVGPYAYLRPGACVGDGCRIGDFVELKNCTIGNGTKVSHLTYIGDADFGENINVGCGVVVVNYDGKDKFRTKVGDGAFVGCNTNLISPVAVGKKAYIAAGSTITEDVPAGPGVLAVARSRQTIITDWSDRRGGEDLEKDRK